MTKCYESAGEARIGRGGNQGIQPPDGKAVIEHWGKIAFVLHREADGSWKVQQEMWNSGPKAE